jgi:hypothetical protein
MAVFVRLICEAKGRIGNVGVTRKSQPAYVNTLKILLMQTFTQADWKRWCSTASNEFIENVYDEQTDKYVFVRVERGLLVENPDMTVDVDAKNVSIWYGVHKDDIKKLGL